jgi:hypothetical protein
VIILNTKDWISVGVSAADGVTEWPSKANEAKLADSKLAVDYVRGGDWDQGSYFCKQEYLDSRS